MKYQYITCNKCGTTLRVPKNIGRLAVTCPKCRYQFEFGSGKKQTWKRILKILAVCFGFIVLLDIYYFIPGGEGLVAAILLLAIGIALFNRFCKKPNVVQTGINTSHAGLENARPRPNPNPASRPPNRDPTFNIIKEDSIVGRYFQAVALMNRAGLQCTGITLNRESSDFLDYVRFAAEFQGLGTILEGLTGYLAGEGKRIEQEYQIKTSAINNLTTQAYAHAYHEASEARKRVQDLAMDKFFKNVLKQADTVSSRELIASPFCFAGSSGEIILDEDFWAIAPGGVGIYKVKTHFVPKHLKNRGYKSKRVIPAMKMLAAQYGLNVPITEGSR